MSKFVIGAIAVLFLSSLPVRSDEKGNEPALRVEIGGSGEWGFRGGQSFGPEIGLEYQVIKNWLEIEAAVNPLFSRGQAEIGTDLIFKKPFELKDGLEFEIGGGLEWRHRTNGEADSAAGLAVAELIYDVLPEQHVSVFLEPAYSYDFGKGHEQGISVTVGLFIGIK